ncbi:hypothetical protein FRC10_005409 [Ceratobasidium sp. 414]|nr:hypothetical protein FRC10_005409 [Ceratobasidium sp. 414]
MSTTTAPPSYDATMAQLDKLQAQGLSPETKAKAQVAVAAALEDGPMIDEYMEEIRVLTRTTIQIDQDFQKVYVALGTVDSSGFNFPAKLQPKWKVFKDEWVKLLWDSRNTATRTRTHLLDFQQVILPMLEEAIISNDFFQLEDAKKELELFVQRPNPFAESESHKRGFKELAEKLEDFKATFENFTRAQQQAIEASIVSLKNQINSITLEIQKCDQMAAKLGALLGITLFATGVGAIAALVALGPLGPLVAIKVLIVGAIAAIGEMIALKNYQNRSRELTNQRRAKEAELKALEDKLALLKKIEALLEAQKTTIGDIASRLNRFADIWTAIQFDAQTLLEQMQLTSESASVTALRIRVGILKKTYYPLVQGLRLYATGIDNSGIPKV